MYVIAFYMQDRRQSFVKEGSNAGACAIKKTLFFMTVSINNMINTVVTTSSLIFFMDNIHVNVSVTLRSTSYETNRS